MEIRDKVFVTLCKRVWTLWTATVVLTLNEAKTAFERIYLDKKKFNKTLVGLVWQ